MIEHLTTIHLWVALAYHAANCMVDYQPVWSD